MQRFKVTPGEIPAVEDILGIQRATLRVASKLAETITGNVPVADGIDCEPTQPATMAVYLSSGTLYWPTVVDSTAFGVLPLDLSPAMKLGDYVGGTIPVAAPDAAGTEVVFLVEATFSEPDTHPRVNDYYNSANPNQPWSGPNNSGQQEFTQREGLCSIVLKSGAPAPAGHALQPGVDPGYVGLWLIRVPAGATTIVSTMISPCPGAPRFSSRLVGGASADDLAAESQARAQGDTALSNALTANVNNLNGEIAAEAQARAQGDANEAAARAAIRPGSSVIETHGASGIWTVPGGITRLKVTVVGGGAGGMGCDGNQAGPGGGGGGTAVRWFDVAPGQQFALTIGAGGASGFNSGINSGSGGGGTTSFGSVVSATGGGPAGVLAGSTGGMGYGGDLNVPGECGTDSSQGSAIYGGKGGNSGLGYGSGGRAATSDNQDAQGVLINGQGFGGGGGGGYQTSAAGYGGAGSPGVIIIEY